jgi:hypothetical protein
MINCAIIKELLPLYTDDVLSEESKASVSEHLAACESCKNEFINMQSEVKKIHHDDGAKINVLKSMKKKVFRQKVISAVLATVIGIAFAIGASWYFSNTERAIQYSQGMVWAEITSREFLVDGIPTTLPVIDILSNRIVSSGVSRGRIININGIETEIIFLYSRETMSTRRMSNTSGEQHTRIASNIGVTLIGGIWDYESGIDIVVRNTHPIEVYYLVFESFADLSDEDFFALRNDGVLLWSGTLEVD